MRFTAFDDSAPPANGFYLVKWESNDEPVKVLLTRVEPEPQDDPPESEVHCWVWQEDESDDPESICLDIADPGQIQWAFEGVAA